MLIDGKIIAKEIETRIAKKVKSTGMKYSLAIILVGDNKSSELYVNLKKDKGRELGVNVIVYKFPSTASASEIKLKTEKLNLDPKIKGIIIQLPLPDNLKSFEKEIINSISPAKDIDGLSAINLGKTWQKEPCYISATALSIMKCLEKTQTDLKGKNVLITNDSVLIGKPLAALLVNKHATVTIAHKDSKQITDLIKKSEIIITAVGKKDFITKKDINENQIIIDAGIVKDGKKIWGDVSRDIYDKVKYITPVPGGVGPVTVSCLFANLVDLEL